MDRHNTAYLQQFSVQAGTFFEAELARRQGLSVG